MNDNYSENAKSMSNSFVDAFKQIDEAAEEAFSNIEQRSEKASQGVKSSSKKAADYQAEYDSLISQKRMRTLSDYENKRLEILKNGIDFYKNLRNMEFDDIKTKLALNEITNEEYYSALAILRDKYFAEGSKKWNQYTLEIAKYNQGVISEQEKAIEEMLSGVEEKYAKSYANILDKQNEIKEKLDDGLKIYENVHFSMGEGKESDWLRLTDIDEDLQILKRYNNALIGAKEKVNEIFDGMGMSDDKAAEMKSHFFEQITELSVGKGTAFANHISSQPDDALQTFVEKWVEKVDLADAISKNLYTDESERLIEGYAEDMSNVFSKTLSEKFGTIPDTFFTNGEKSALGFKNGFMSVIDEALSSIETELERKITEIMPNINVMTSGNNVTNNSSYNIYKQEEKKKMLIGG